MWPISIVDGQVFKNYSYAPEPSYIVPSHSTIRTYVRKSYQDAKEALIENIKAQDAVALTTDIWTSHAAESYLTLTCHFINDSFEMRFQLLATRKMLERHTGANISIHEFQLPPIAAIVRDNASNMDLATKILGHLTQGCFGHTLQLAMGKALDEDCFVAPNVRYKRIVAFFNRFVLAHYCFMAKQEKGWN